MGENVNTLENVIDFPFKYIDEGEIFESPYERTKMLMFETKEIKGTATALNIITGCKKYLEYFSYIYKNSDVYNLQVDVSNYTLCVIYNNEKNNEEEEKLVYRFVIENDRITIKDEFPNRKIPEKYKLRIEIFLTHIVYGENEEEENIVENIEDFILARKEIQCCICYVNEPNILYQDCNHCVTCSECESQSTLRNCPFCRTIVTKRKIQINMI